ncbi:MAG: nickel-type superoxide dismutase maturation protease [Candidatus Nanopelagicales bacterium]
MGTEAYDGLPSLHVRVSGASMEPALREGDRLLCRDVTPRRPVRAGDVVVARRPDRPSLLLVKRAVRREPDGWWLEGDNPAASDDSRLFGPVADELVLGRAVLRWWPRPRAL